MNRLLPILLLAVSLSACHSKHDQVQEAAQSNPTVPPPTGPVCTSHMYHSDGGIGGPPPTSMHVVIPNFDTIKGDTADFSYKKWNATAWSLYRPGFYSPVTFTVAHSTVTITNTSPDQYDWAMAATIWTCQ